MIIHKPRIKEVLCCQVENLFDFGLTLKVKFVLISIKIDHRQLSEKFLHFIVFFVSVDSDREDQ